MQRRIVRYSVVRMLRGVEFYLERRGIVGLGIFNVGFVVVKRMVDGNRREGSGIR